MLTSRPNPEPIGTPVPADPETGRDTALYLTLIGQMQAHSSQGRSVLPLGRKTRGLLAILALSAPRAMMRSRLAELLWSRRPEEQARASLRQEIHRLSEALEPAGAAILRVTRDHLSLHRNLVHSDVEDALSATQADPAVLATLTGPLLEDFDGLDPVFELWLAAEREKLRSHARTIAESLLSQQDSADGTIAAAQRLIEIDRGHEAAWRALVRAYADQGERGLAIQAYERCRVALAEALDAAPSIETQRLVADIRAGTHAVAVSRPGDPNPIRLPTRRKSVMVGVLPLHLVDLGPEKAPLSLGLAEEIAAALSHFRWLSLVPPGAMHEYRREDASLRRTHEPDLLLDGHLQPGPRGLRLTLHLSELREDRQIVWSGHFDSEHDDLLRLQDEVVGPIAAQLGIEIGIVESRRAAPWVFGGADASAYELIHRAYTLTNRLGRAEFDEAEALLRRALLLEPDYDEVHSTLAYHLAYRVGQGWANDETGTIDEAVRHADRAIVLDPRNARAFTVAGHTRAFLQHRLQDALELHARAMSLNPYSSMAWGFSAATYIYLGDVEEAARRLARYRWLNPTDPLAFVFDGCMVLVELQRRDYEAAIRFGRRACELNPNYSVGTRHYLAALGHAGQREEAARIRARLLAIEPQMTVQRAIHLSPYEQEAERMHYAAGLRAAGLPEGERTAW